MSGNKLTLLVIDDDPGDAILLQRQLEDIPGWDAEVIVHQDPLEARKRLRKQAVDIVILDYLLGPVTGLEVLRDIRGEGDERPVILLTGHGDERIAAEITRAGADDYLVKAEMTPDQLRRSIEGALAQYRLRQEKALLAEELRQSQKMEAIGQLAGGLAHDFNNMLTGILGFVELALMKSHEKEVEADLVQVQNTALRMKDLIRRLLSFSRRSRSEYAPVELGQLIRELETILAHSIPKNVELKIEMGPEKLCLYGNAGMLHQVLLNLCLNAVEAMSRGGVLRIGLRKIEDGQELRVRYPHLAKGPLAALEVEDTGKGIEREHLDRIFEPFYTTKNLSSEKGTGLGLAIVWQNVREHDGAVEVTSEPGHGSVFRVYLPLGAANGQPGGLPAEERMTEGNETILVVDDEALVRDVASRMLKRLGYRVLTAADGRSAIDLYGERVGDIDAVILDLSMPGMDGEQCLKRLVEIDPGVRVLISSGHNLDDLDDGVSQTICGVIQKPYRIRELAGRVRGVLDGA